MKLALVALVLVTTSSGCFLPLSTAAPQSATTVGKGRLGATFYGEMPTADLLASENPTGEDFATAPSPTMTFQVAYGLADSFDLEAALDGQMWLFLVPLPLGASIGGRLAIAESETLAVAAAGRIGSISGEAELDNGGDNVGGSATYGSLTLTGQLNPRGAVRPGAALSYLPASVKYDPEGQGTEHFSAHAVALTGSLTFALGNLEVAPFANLTYLTSDRIDGAWVSTGGLSIAGRPRRRPPAPAPPPPPRSGPPGQR